MTITYGSLSSKLFMMSFTLKETARIALQWLSRHCSCCRKQCCLF